MSRVHLERLHANVPSHPCPPGYKLPLLQLSLVLHRFHFSEVSIWCNLYFLFVPLSPDYLRLFQESMAQSAWSVGEQPLDSLDEVQKDPSWTKCELTFCSFVLFARLLIRVTSPTTGM
jgi:hypothetical protein